MRELKKQLIENPEYIISILEHFKFTNIKLLRNEIRFSYGENHDAAGIRIKLMNNDGLFVQDFVRADNKGDLISYNKSKVCTIYRSYELYQKYTWYQLIRCKEE